MRELGVKLGEVHLERVRRVVPLLLLPLLLGSPGLSCLWRGLLPGSHGGLSRRDLPGRLYWLPGCLRWLSRHLGRLSRYLSRLTGHLGLLSGYLGQLPGSLSLNRLLPWHLGHLPGSLNRLPPRYGRHSLGLPGAGCGDALEVELLRRRSRSLPLLLLPLVKEGRLLRGSAAADPGGLVPPGEAGGEVGEGLGEGGAQRGELALLLRLRLLSRLLLYPRLLLLQFAAGRCLKLGLAAGLLRLPLSAAVSPEAVGVGQPLLEALLKVLAVDLVRRRGLPRLLSGGLEELRLRRGRGRPGAPGVRQRLQGRNSIDLI